ncbi:MAG: hypothetical protein M0026_11980 [Nocardiopsaceae bacterium]|nr:hypothetical protein [Nocardiopsaceae bacterium]
MKPLVERLSRVEAMPKTQRRLLIAATVGVIVAVAVTAGVVWGGSGPALPADEADTYVTAPGCASVPDAAVDSVIPSAELETNEHGVLDDADNAVCAWTSVGAEGEAPRSLRVDFTAYFTDKADAASGAQTAAEQVSQVSSVSALEGAAPAPSLGEDALVWPSSVGDAWAEAVFRRSNMVVRVYYGGNEDTGGDGLSYEAARDGAVSVAEQVAEEL